MGIDVVTLALAKGYTDGKIRDAAFGDMSVTGATVGQTIVVKAVDETGKPIAWEPVDMPDSMSIGMELGVIDPVVDENNVLYTDENGAIYSL